MEETTLHLVVCMVTTITPSQAKAHTHRPSHNRSFPHLNQQHFNHLPLIYLCPSLIFSLCEIKTLTKVKLVDGGPMITSDSSSHLRLDRQLADKQSSAWCSHAYILMDQSFWHVAQMLVIGRGNPTTSRKRQEQRLLAT